MKLSNQPYYSIPSTKLMWVVIGLCVCLVYTNIIQPTYALLDSETTHMVDVWENMEDKGETEEEPNEEKKENKDKDKIKVNFLSSLFNSDHIILNIKSTIGFHMNPIIDIIIPPPDLA